MCRAVGLGDALVVLADVLEELAQHLLHHVGASVDFQDPSRVLHDFAHVDRVSLQTLFLVLHHLQSPVGELSLGRCILIHQVHKAISRPVHELRNLHITVYRMVSLLESLIDIFQG
jgi:hypothetical protein